VLRSTVKLVLFDQVDEVHSRQIVLRICAADFEAIDVSNAFDGVAICAPSAIEVLRRSASRLMRRTWQRKRRSDVFSNYDDWE